MRRLALTLLIMLACKFVLLAQSDVFNRIDSLDCRPLVIVNGKIVDPLSFLALDRLDIQDFKVFTPEQALKKFNNARCRFGAVQITLVKSAKIFTWHELAQRFYFIPRLLPIAAKLYYGYFGGLIFNNQESFIISASKSEGMGVNMRDFDINKPVVFIDVKDIKEKNDGDGKLVFRPFDKEIDTVKKIFDAESEKRVAIENAKPRIEG